ncbi:class I SAM-dependent methyltransferase [Yinghuangia seranimata]|uniref:class I SAM-dependent methyltransferase n=1 Tax=Yinghuangia seranimata TaxID=408067 RepID=UPI00248BF438|nr:class I SAM-dependent methyltransferase [Yinghuangia seranimata]MDI2130660.1 class I SAM-dependent methyltransferase [Yinghuangia seranimata]
MPTLPSGQPPLPATEPHRSRDVAESFGADATRYDRARPRYPDEVVQRIAAAAPEGDILDVGTGTGIAARQLRAAGRRVLGVEPDPRMAEVARGLGLEVDVATFEDWDPVGRTFSAVVAAQAWHWIDPVAGAAKAARVLHPGGVFAPFWNAFVFPPALADAVTDVCRRVMPDAPFDIAATATRTVDGYRDLTTKAAEGVRKAGEFGETEHWQADWEWTYTRDAWLDQMPTLGAFTRTPPPVLARLLDGVGAAVDAMGGAFTMTYATIGLTATRTGRS